MTLQEFCTYFTKIGELVAIREEGDYVRSLVLIDRENNNEDIFVIPECYRDKKVVSDSWGTIDTIYEDGVWHEVCCHYVDIEG